MDPQPPTPDHSPASAGRTPLDAAESDRASRIYWDGEADSYQSEHGSFLGREGVGFVWGPEGIREEDLRLLGDPSGRRMLEVGAGAAQCSAWLIERGADCVALDISARMLAHARSSGSALPVGVASAASLPLRAGSFDIAFSSYGAIPFIAEVGDVFAEVARVLKPGGLWVFSQTHPIRWAFPDVPGEAGLTAAFSYFDRTPYVERDEDGRAVYVEHHRTMGDLVRELVAHGFHIENLVEPEWPEENHQEWGGWSPLRGRYFPGTAIFACRKN